MAKKSIVLSATPRVASGKGGARQTRRDGRVPGVIYGKSTETQLISVDAHEFEKIYDHSGMIEVRIGKEDACHVLIKSYQCHPISGEILHVDLLAVRMDERVRAIIPVEPVGEPAGEQQGGQLEQSIHSIEVECLPQNLPELIQVDVSLMALGDTLTVSQVILPKDVKLAHTDTDEVVFHVTLPKAEEEEVVEGGEGAAEGEEGAEKAEETSKDE